MNYKTMVIGLIIILMGLLSSLAENYFYGGVDENNVLQESFFLPLSFILLGIGFSLIIIAIFQRLIINSKK